MTRSGRMKATLRVAALLAIGTGLAACTQGNATMSGHSMAGSMAAPMADSKPAALRSDLNMLLGEHVVLAAAATNAALGGRQAEFEAAAAALDANSVDLSQAIGSVYGAEAGEAEGPHGVERRRARARGHVERRVRPVEVDGREGGVEHHRRQRVADR